jgi:hypothetical protein
LEKYLDVYDISNPDIQEAQMGYLESEFEDTETLKALRTLQYRLSILRRVLLCSLLALDADGGKTDFARWRLAVQAMEPLALSTANWSEKINRTLGEEERMQTPTSWFLTRLTYCRIGNAIPTQGSPNPSTRETPRLCSKAERSFSRHQRTAS